MFHISYTHAIWLSLPAIYANFYGFVWATGRQLCHMAKSGLLPIQLSYMSWSNTPYIASICGTLVCFFIVLCAYYNVFYISFSTDLFRISVLCSYIVYLMLFYSYLIFKDKYSSLAREFHSPLGMFGALLGMTIFSMNAIGMLGFECGQTNQMPLIILSSITCLSTIVYYFILHGNQTFSPEERDQLFKAYLINANIKTRQMMKQRNKAAAAAANIAINANSNNINNNDSSSVMMKNSLQSNSTITATTATTTTRIPIKKMKKHNHVVPEDLEMVITSSKATTNTSNNITNTTTNMLMSPKEEEMLPAEQV